MISKKPTCVPRLTPTLHIEGRGWPSMGSHSRILTQKFTFHNNAKWVFFAFSSIKSHKINLRKKSHVCPKKTTGHKESSDTCCIIVSSTDSSLQQCQFFSKNWPVEVMSTVILCPFMRKTSILAGSPGADCVSSWAFRKNPVNIWLFCTL